MSQAPQREAVTPVQVRAEFEQLIVDDLYGTAGGPDEALDVTPQDRYLVGMLAPQRSLPEPGEETETGDPAAGDDAGPPDESAKPMLFPSSKGLSFVVPAGTPAVLVDATWGRYLRTEASAPEPSEGEAEPEQSSAKAGLIWQREAAGDTVAVDLPQQGGRILPVSPDPGQPEASSSWLLLGCWRLRGRGVERPPGLRLAGP